MQEKDKVQINGAVLKEIAKIMCYTQADLAKDMTVGQSTVSRVFSGDTEPTPDFVEKFIAATGVSKRFIENYEPQKDMRIVNFNNGSNNAGVNEHVENINLNITQNDLKAVLNLGREKEILLIKQHIAQLEHNILLAKMNKNPESEIDQFESQINAKLKEIEEIKAQITK